MNALTRRSLLAALAPLAIASSGAASAQGGRVGVVLLHGKRSTPGAALGPVAGALESAGAVTIAPDLPWSSARYLSGTWGEAMGEIAGAIQQVRGRGASRVFLVGHSMGCPAAMSFAAQAGNIAGIVLAAPGHSPRQYVRFTPEVRDSIETARQLVRAGRGSQVGTFYDNNQGNLFTLQVSAAQYLSFFDPAGPCEMSNTAGRVRCPAFWVVGTGDAVIRWGDPIAQQLTRRRGGSYLAVPGAGHGNTPASAAPEITRWIMST